MVMALALALPAAARDKQYPPPKLPARVLNDLKKLPRKPNPKLKPEQVVNIVMTALQYNDVPRPDAGISTTFNFASPANHLITGPLPHFTLMVKGTSYQPMIGFKTMKREPIKMQGSRAFQQVTVTTSKGDQATYVFELSRQRAGTYKGCWLTDGVMRVGGRPPSPKPATRSPGVDI